MKLSKENVINEELFDALIKVNPVIVKKMIYNMVKMDSEKKDETVNTDEINDWVRVNCNGLVYFADVGGRIYGNHLIYRFENEEDMVAFKLMWS